VLPEQVVNRVLLGDPTLERHAARTGDLEAVAIESRLAGIRRETAVPTVKCDELLHVIGEVHLVTAYSMIWSARSRTDGGIVSRRALAVFALITSSNFVDCSMTVTFYPPRTVAR